MSTPPDPPDDEPVAALEPSTEPEHPMRAEDCLPLCGKDIA